MGIAARSRLNAALRRNAPWRFALLGVVAAATLARRPELLAEPRFWAEEGVLYFASAFNLPWREALLGVHQGYFSFFANTAALIAAATVEIEWAPLVTTLFGLFAQLTPFAMILWGSERPMAIALAT